MYRPDTAVHIPRAPKWALWCVSSSVVHALYIPEQHRASIDAVAGEARAFSATHALALDEPHTLTQRLFAYVLQCLPEALTSALTSDQLHTDYVPFAAVLAKCEAKVAGLTSAPSASAVEAGGGEQLLCTGPQCRQGAAASYGEIREALSRGHFWYAKVPVVFKGCQAGRLTKDTIVGIQTPSMVVKGVFTESYCRVTTLEDVDDGDAKSYKLQLTSLEGLPVKGTYSYHVRLDRDNNLYMEIKRKIELGSWLFRQLEGLVGQASQKAVGAQMKYIRSMVTEAPAPDAEYMVQMFSKNEGGTCTSNGDCSSADCAGGICKGGSMVCPLQKAKE